MDPENDKSLDKLRELILGPESTLGKLQVDFDNLKTQFADKEAMIAMLDPVFGDLLERKISDSKEDMAETLAPIMGEAIKRQVIETREEVVDALYPVIGKTIRKSVAEAMKDQLSSVNKKIERSIRHSFLPTWLRSKLLGIPRAQLFMKESLPFKIEQIFIIHAETGILISHISAYQSDNTVDQELISGMLTAIRDFVAQAFESHEHDLREIQYGQSKIILDIGRYSYLAVVVSGFQSENFYEEVWKLNQRIYNRYYRSLRQFQGDTSDFQSASILLVSFMDRHNATEKAPDKKELKPYLLYILRVIFLILVVSMTAYVLPVYWREYKVTKTIQQQVDNVSPLSQHSIRIQVDEEKVILTGNVNTFVQKAAIDSLVKMVPEVSSVENKLQVIVPAISQEELLRQLMLRLNLYDSLQYFQPHIQVDNDHVILGGFVPDSKLKREIGFLVSEIPGIRLVTNNLIVLNDKELVEVRGFLRENAIQFSPFSVQFDSSQISKLDIVVNIFKSFKNKTALMVVRGYSDDVIDFYENLRLSKSRAQVVFKQLQKKGIEANDLILVSYGEKFIKPEEESKRSRVFNSRVEFDIILGR